MTSPNATPHRLSRAWVVIWVALIVLSCGLSPASAQRISRTSKPIAAVLREPLPSEDLKLSECKDEWIITGPTFTYHVQKTTGIITALRVHSAGRERISTSRPFQILLDNHQPVTNLGVAQVTVTTQTAHRIVLRSQGTLRDSAQHRPDVDCTSEHTFFNDGVVVTAVDLVPQSDLSIEKSLIFQAELRGEFSHYLHKRRDEHGESAERGLLPEPGNAARFSTLTSCLQVSGQQAAFALFTDCGATYLSRTNLDSARVEVVSRTDQHANLNLCQYLLHVTPGEKPYLLKGGEAFRFRVGLSVAPNRIAPARLSDLRMFAWVGDAKFPYPSDREIETVAQYGYTLFQMHRLGTPGEPRPPADELQRVINKVHASGMLFLWTENADLMYDSAPGVQKMKAESRFSEWQGFNYGGRYKASMDPYCDLVATCLASPNSLSEYRLATIARMLERFAVDGIYLDDNLAYPNCTLWREHGHPRPVYDCLIELHEMNWQRRQLLRSKCPHLVLVSHNTRAIILPVLCDFDAVLYGEGYSFGSMENYLDYYRPVRGFPAQGMIWPGGQDPVRCEAAVAYNYDLLTGGGQYCYIDWRLFTNKFSYGAGVTGTEHLYVQTYNLAQYYFGLYESTPYYFAESTNLFSTSTPLTYGTVYHNQVWNDWLIVLGNMDLRRQKSGFELRAPRNLGFSMEDDYLLFDLLTRSVRPLKEHDLGTALRNVSIPAQNVRLFCLRRLPNSGVCHVWGGKRISEEWDDAQRKLVLAVQGPAGLEETLFFGCVRQPIERVEVDGRALPFSFDPAAGLVHGKVTFHSSPLKVVVRCSSAAAHALPQESVSVAPLAEILNGQH